MDNKLTQQQQDNMLEFMECWVCPKCEKWLRYTIKKCKCNGKSKNN
jgi:hypothetical protein